MRELTDHKFPGKTIDQFVTVRAEDVPDASGASHRYGISVHNVVPQGESNAVYGLRFQQGPLNEVGANGITNEALLAIVLDRMRGFQNGPFNNRENAIVITKLEEAMHWLHHRTRDRLARGVEGVNAQ